MPNDAWREESSPATGLQQNSHPRSRTRIEHGVARRFSAGTQSWIPRPAGTPETQANSPEVSDLRGPHKDYNDLLRPRTNPAWQSTCPQEIAMSLLDQLGS